jgi:hypothetical protein
MPDERIREEFAALRATIQSRGTARMVLVPVIFIGWAVTAVATAAAITVAISTLVPLMVLAAGFEAIVALNTNVERIGRYLQVFHEDAVDGDLRSARWEDVAFSFSQRFPAGRGTDPLFSRLFIICISVNFLPAALGGDIPELVVLAVLHLLFVNRIRLASAAAARQRAEDLERFRALKRESTRSQESAPPL